MDDPVVLHHLQCRQHLHRKPPDQACREAHKVVGFDEFIEVQAQELGDNAQVASEREFFDNLDEIVLVLGVLRECIRRAHVYKIDIALTHSTRFSRIRTSTNA